MPAKPDGYIFWCSKCKVDHAGECETEELTITVPIAQRWWNTGAIYYYSTHPGHNGTIKIDDDGK